jgi:hypothetical protein
MKTAKQEKTESSICFQDTTLSAHDTNEDVSLVFFELANAPYVSYRFGKHNKDNEEEDSSSTEGSVAKKQSPHDCIVVKQDVTACGEHTGGIVWETAYLLLNFLRTKNSRLKNTLELGAGCGMVGQALNACGLSKNVIMTEIGQVMPNLLANVERNKMHDEKASLQAHTLDWNIYESDCTKAKIAPHSMDTLVGTDVVFSTRLVEPLLRTMSYLAHSKTKAYLCLQERCKDSHQLLLDKAKDYGFQIDDISDYVTSLPSCEWGKELDCCVLKFTVMNGKKKRKR